jgi:predicted ester cyclase
VLRPIAERVGPTFPSKRRCRESTARREAELECRKDLLRRLAANAGPGGDDSVMDEIFDENYVHHDPVLPEGLVDGTRKGLEGYRNGREQNRIAFPDSTSDTEVLLADGEYTARRYRFSGTMTGPLIDQPPTGKRVEYWALNLYRWGNGKVVEGWTLLPHKTKYERPTATSE